MDFKNTQLQILKNHWRTGGIHLGLEVVEVSTFWFAIQEAGLLDHVYASSSVLEFLLKITFKFGAINCLIVLNGLDLRSEINDDANSDRQILEQLSHTIIQVLKTKYLYHYDSDDERRGAANEKPFDK